MSKHLNEETSKTEKVIHLLVTILCDRNCSYCCNKQYSLDDVPYVTEEELNKAEIICLTGGEPFEYSQPNEIAKYLKQRYKNIKNVYVYTNAVEFAQYLQQKNGKIENIDGVNVSIKNVTDSIAFDKHIVSNPDVLKLKSNLLYVFGCLRPEMTGNFILKYRVWQTDFIPADDSIFRKI